MHLELAALLMTTHAVPFVLSRSSLIRASQRNTCASFHISPGPAHLSHSSFVLRFQPLSSLLSIRLYVPSLELYAASEMLLKRMRGEA